MLLTKISPVIRPKDDVEPVADWSTTPIKLSNRKPIVGMIRFIRSPVASNHKQTRRLVTDNHEGPAIAAAKDLREVHLIGG